MVAGSSTFWDKCKKRLKTIAVASAVTIGGLAWWLWPSHSDETSKAPSSEEAAASAGEQEKAEKAEKLQNKVRQQADKILKKYTLSDIDIHKAANFLKNGESVDYGDMNPIYVHKCCQRYGDVGGRYLTMLLNPVSDRQIMAYLRENGVSEQDLKGELQAFKDTYGYGVCDPKIAMPDMKADLERIILDTQKRLISAYARGGADELAFRLKALKEFQEAFGAIESKISSQDDPSDRIDTVKEYIQQYKEYTNISLPKEPTPAEIEAQREAEEQAAAEKKAAEEKAAAEEAAQALEERFQKILSKHQGSGTNSTLIVAHYDLPSNILKQKIGPQSTNVVDCVRKIGEIGSQFYSGLNENLTNGDIVAYAREQGISESDFLRRYRDGNSPDVNPEIKFISATNRLAEIIKTERKSLVSLHARQGFSPDVKKQAIVVKALEEFASSLSEINFQEEFGKEVAEQVEFVRTKAAEFEKYKKVSLPKAKTAAKKAPSKAEKKKWNADKIRDQIISLRVNVPGTAEILANGGNYTPEQLNEITQECCRRYGKIMHDYLGDLYGLNSEAEFNKGVGKMLQKLASEMQKKKTDLESSYNPKRPDASKNKVINLVALQAFENTYRQNIAPELETKEEWAQKRACLQSWMDQGLVMSQNIGKADSICPPEIQTRTVIRPRGKGSR